MNEKSSQLDDLIETIDLIRKCIPAELRNCHDIDYEMMAWSFRKVCLATYNLSVKKEEMEFGISDGQGHQLIATVKIENDNVYLSLSIERD